ncbi:MAG: hypothetical protein K5987_06075 [Lachnospiraceae bacterium]|nr:hypothetical protein [Lachnospiraceae bacterium]MCR4937704.1 hypothetical protein [Lachnospiraceae bacterium]
MGFFSRLFGKIKNAGREEETYGDWENTEYEELEGFDDPDVRSVYILEALERMEEASIRTDRNKDEYDAVTSLLVDMEEIDSMDVEKRLKVTELAGDIERLEKARRDLVYESGLMEEERIEELERMGDKIPEGISRMREAEDYRKLVLRDLKRLDSERAATRYREKEDRIILENSRGIALICVAAMSVCIGILILLRFKFEMDVRWGYLIISAMGAITLTGLFVRHMDAARDLKRLRKLENRLIVLQNTVKIRYVNNTKLLSYMYMKYSVESSEELAQDWETYNSEIGARIKDRKLSAELTDAYRLLMQTLDAAGIRDTDVWTRQTGALLDPREMVEVRHSLIARRQKLREQLEYNKEVAENEGKRIKEMAAAFPEYSDEIAEMVKRYRGHNEH